MRYMWLRLLWKFLVLSPEKQLYCDFGVKLVVEVPPPKVVAKLNTGYVTAGIPTKNNLHRAIGHFGSIELFVTR